MTTERRLAAIAGTCFLVATVASIVGGGMAGGVVDNPDRLAAIPQALPILYAGVALELVNALCVVGIAVSLFGFLKRRHESVALAYLGIRLFEALACAAAAFVPVVLVAVAGRASIAGPLEAETLRVAGAVLADIRSSLSAAAVPLFFCLGAAVLYLAALKPGILPRFLAVWGLVAVGLVAAMNLAGIGLPAGLLFALPIILNEIVLGVWLIVKGCPAAPAAQAAVPADGAPAGGAA
jgi:hypothetical protein